MSAQASALPWWLACWQQWLAERALLRRGVEFRSTASDVVAHGYDAMSPNEFDAVNSRQEWANWHVLPALFKGRLPQRALTAIDLGCGTGASTQAIARCCPAGSQVLAMERSARLLQQAMRREYLLRDGGRVAVQFRRQSIAEPWRTPDGFRLPSGAVDLVVSCGVIGHHFNHWTIGPVISELRRVLKLNGLACLDAGPALPRDELAAAMAAHGFRELAQTRSCIFDRNRQLLFRKAPSN